MKYRHEWKHEISYGDMLVLRQRLSTVMKRDKHAIDSKYLNRSLYFDNASDKALREKVDGVNICIYVQKTEIIGKALCFK